MKLFSIPGHPNELLEVIDSDDTLYIYFVPGLLHSGIGYSNLKKLLACLNIPPISFETLKRYEVEAGQAVEATARESCERAIQLERQLTIENAEMIKQQL